MKHVTEVAGRRRFSIGQWSWIPLVVGALLVGGCGEANPYDLAPVSGTITLDGKPLAYGRITFQPTGGGPGSFGTCDDQGHYALETLDGDDGAVVASHTVAIYSAPSQDPPTSEDGRRGASKEAVPMKYNYRSTLTFDVPADGTTTANWDLKSK